MNNKVPKFKVRKYTSSGRRKTQDEILDAYYANYKVKCKCGHTFLMYGWEGKKLCNHCGYYYYMDKKLEFKERIMQLLKKQRKE